jgi:HEAT repeat protein
VADPVIEGRSLVLEAIRSMGIACRAWAAYPSDHPNVTRAVDAAQTRVGEMLSAHGSVAIGVARKHLRVGVWTLESAQARALAQVLYQRQVAVLRIDRGLQPDEFRALVLWLAGPAVPLEPGSAATGPPTMPGARHLHLQPLDYSAVRLTDRAPETTAQPGAVSLSDRLLNVVLEWGTPGDVDWDWESDQPTTGAAVPAELAMVGWLRKFLKEQAARERGERPANGAETGAQAGEPGAADATSATGGSGSGPGAGEDGEGQGPGPGGPADAADAAGLRNGGTPGPGRGGTGPPVPLELSEPEPGPIGDHAAATGQPGEAAGDQPSPTVFDIAAVVGGNAETATDTATPASADAPDDGSWVPGLTPRQLLVKLTDTTTAYFQGMSGAGRALAARQTAQLIMRLPEPLRESLMRAALRVVATDPEGEDAFQAFTSSMSSHPVLRVLRQLSAEGVPLSRHAQRLVELLASTRPNAMEEETPTVRDLETLRGELLTLFRDEDIDRYNPEDHLALLARTMLAWPTRTPVELGTLESLGDRVATLTEEAVDRQLAETLFDLLGRYQDEKAEPVLARLSQLVQGALARGSLDEAAYATEGMTRLAADEAVPEPTRAALRAQIERLADPETLSVLAASLGATPGAAAVQLVRLLGPGAIRSLLRVLVQEKVRVRRRRIFDLLSALGADVVPEATHWLMDPNWYVVRNIIALLRTVGDHSSLPTVRRLTGHADLRVRLEALRSLLELDPATGHDYLVSAIADPDPRAATAAVELAGQRGGAAMVDPLLDVVRPWDIRGRRRAVRLAALQALGRVGRPEALPRLARFFRERWVPFGSRAERRAAYESLQGYPSDVRSWLVMRGLRSRDQEIRAVCERLRSAG